MMIVLDDKILKLIKLVINLTDNNIIFTGSISSHLNGVDYGWPIKDVDIIINDRSILEEIMVFGHVDEFTVNMFEEARASIKIEDTYIDVFIREGDTKYITKNYNGLEIKHEPLEDTISYLKKCIDRFNIKETKVFFLKYQHKLHACMDTYNKNNNTNN